MMVAESRVYPVEGAAVRAWVRANVPLVDGHAFFGWNNATSGPQIVITSIGGEPWTLYQFDCWASTMREAEEVAAELETALSMFAPFTFEEATIRGVAISSRHRWLPDDENDHPRYVVDAWFMVMAGGEGS